MKKTLKNERVLRCSHLLARLGVALILLCQSQRSFAGGAEQMDLIKGVLALDVASVEAILSEPEKKAKINLAEKRDDGWNALSLASAMGSVPLVQLLLAQGAPLSDGFQFQGQNVPPLVLAAMYDRAAVLECMLKSASFKSQDYQRAIRVAAHFLQNSLVDELFNIRALTLPELPGAAGAAVALPEGLIEERFQDDRLARAVKDVFPDVCGICQDHPGASSKKRLLNGSMRAGDIAITQCGHCFCQKCLSRAREVVNQCPLCRADLRAHIVERDSKKRPVWTAARPLLPFMGAVPAAGGEPEVGVLKGYTFIDLPAVTQGDVQALSEAVEDTSIRVPFASFKIADALTSAGLFQAVMGDYPDNCSEFEVARWNANPELPVTSLTLAEMNAFLQKLSELTGRRFFIPSESQLEYAIRGRVSGVHGGPIHTSLFYFGDNEDDLAQHAWIYSNAGGQVHGVREALPGLPLENSKNSFGLIHPIGNVWTRSKESVKFLALLKKRRFRGVIIFRGIFRIDDAATKTNDLTFHIMNRKHDAITKAIIAFTLIIF
jgi:formylglycine-generating enzyme required for sulfatase activity